MKRSKHTVKNMKICKNIEGQSPIDKVRRTRYDGQSPIEKEIKYLFSGYFYE